MILRDSSNRIKVRHNYQHYELAIVSSKVVAYELQWIVMAWPRWGGSSLRGGKGGGRRGEEEKGRGWRKRRRKGKGKGGKRNRWKFETRNVIPELEI